ncbi:MAG: hypothetical protein A2Z93_11865 [Curvibacter sp. GWA2_64_110]|nr:MAG: hypothetical protein A2Z93_11865 [Curvibacter sp. GWA2_64_110]HCY16183.1 DUF1178 domain-containing protein [Curvibacter sp.]
MKVLNLQCDARHLFEGWFASEDDYAGQLERGLLVCPMCGSKAVAKLPSAPRLNLGAARPEEAAQTKPPSEKQDVVLGDAEQALQAAYLQLARRIVAQTEDVGGRFAEEARKMHYGEVEARGIRGQASREETEALLDEGIAVMPLPLPDALKEPLQ